MWTDVDLAGVYTVQLTAQLWDIHRWGLQRATQQNSPQLTSDMLHHEIHHVTTAQQVLARFMLQDLDLKEELNSDYKQPSQCICQHCWEEEVLISLLEYVLA